MVTVVRLDTGVHLILDNVVSFEPLFVSMIDDATGVHLDGYVGSIKMVNGDIHNSNTFFTYEEALNWLYTTLQIKIQPLFDGGELDGDIELDFDPED